jgi:hypothetical protein
VRRFLLLTIVSALLLAAPSAWAAPGGHRTGQADGHGHTGAGAVITARGIGNTLLTTWWKGGLSQPAGDSNPLFSGGCPLVGKHTAIDYGGECTVPAGTWIFEVGFTTECSNIEEDPFHADTPREARLCGLANDQALSELTVAVDDAAPVSLLDGRFDAFLNPTRITIPVDPIFGGTPGEIMRYGGHGYVALIRPLAVGEHTILLHTGPGPVGVPPEGIDAETHVTVTG